MKAKMMILIWNGRILEIFSILTISTILISCSPQKFDAPANAELNLPLPDFLPWVYPEPNSSLSLHEFWVDDPSLRQSPCSICIEFSPAGLLTEDDDNKEFKDYLSSLSIQVDGEHIKNENLVYIEDELGVDVRLGIDPETGEKLSVVSSNAVGPYRLCWFVDSIEPGNHIVEFDYLLESDEVVSYKWSFAIVE